MKRYISLALSFLLLISAASCGSSGAADTTKPETSAKTDSEDTAAETLSDGLPEKDMDGFTLNILHTSADSLNWATVQLDAEAENGDLVNDAIYKRNVKIEDRFNCDLNISEDTMSNVISAYRNQVAAGDTENDIIMVYGIEVAGLVDSIADFNNLPYINLDAAWWNPNATSIFNIGTKQIAAAGNFSLSYASTANCLLFNKKIYADLNRGEDLYTLVREGTWTTDKFFEVCKSAETDLNGDSKMDMNDRMGATGTIKSFHHMLVIGAGFRYVTMDKDNYPQFAVKSNEKMISFFQKLIKYENDDPYAYAAPPDANSEVFPVDFASGGCLFFVSWPYHISNLRDMKDDFGILPAPKYDAAQTTYYSNMANGELVTLPRTYDFVRIENIGILLEAMSFYTQKEIMPVYKEVLLQTKVSRDEDSSEMLDIIFNGITYDYGINVWQANVGNKIMTDIFMPKTEAVVSTLDSIATSLDAQIEKLKTAVEEMP